MILLWGEITLAKRKKPGFAINNKPRPINF